MFGLIAQLNAIEIGKKYPTMVDLTHRRDGKIVLSYSMPFDMLSDLGLDLDSVNAIRNGVKVPVKLVKDEGE